MPRLNGKETEFPEKKQKLLFCVNTSKSEREEKMLAGRAQPVPVSYAGPAQGGSKQGERRAC